MGIIRCAMEGYLVRAFNPILWMYHPYPPFYKHIKKLKELGIMRGCQIDPPMFCLDGYVTRDAMAVLLYRAFGS